MSNVKASVILKAALERIITGKDLYCCIAIWNTFEIFGVTQEIAFIYFKKQKPENAGWIMWWPAKDKQSRIAALQAAITDAENNGD